jgi:hypothetical protein
MWVTRLARLRVVVGGLVLGVPASLAVGRLLQNNVVRSDAFDLVTLIETVAVLPSG